MALLTPPCLFSYCPGAPKTWAIQFIEDQEASPRAWYGGAVGLVAFDGSLNTGLTLRTIRVCPLGATGTEDRSVPCG